MAKSDIQKEAEFEKIETEIASSATQAWSKAKDEALEKGIPVVIAKDGQLIRIHNGRQVVIGTTKARIKIDRELKGQAVWIKKSQG